MATLQNQLPTIGEMDELIYIGSVTEVLDGSGSLRKTYPDSITPDVRAKVRYAMTNEREDQMQEKFVQEIKIWIRYRSTLTERNVVYWDGMFWDIYSLEKTPRDRFNVLKCRQITQ